ncbi:MAG: hypothetical protein QOF09_3805, partial [Alphaproteobacteria bacterium]|nr:hypothetical protein [Alphaproteobacteria bacterium]
MNFTGEDFARLLDDCSRMLEYAANNGIEIQPPVAEKIAAAREAFAFGNWTPKLEGELYAAKAVLAAAIKPVTPETLASDTIRQAQEMMHFYYKMTLALVVFVVPISMVVFVDSDLSKNGKDLIEKNDKLAL